METKVSDISKIGFKIKWSDFKELDKVCSIEGKRSDSCKRMAKELGIQWHDD